MGLRPCSLHGSRFRGSAQHAYPALLAGVDKVSRRHTLCPSCFGHILEFAQERMQRIGDEANANETVDVRSCVSCTGPLDDWAIAFFLTAYARGEDRQDFYGEAHPACREDVAAHLGLMEQIPLKIAS